jgi:hypothetical protein
MNASRETSTLNASHALNGDPTPATTSVERFDDANTWWSATPDEEGYFCAACGQVLDARVTHSTWNGNPQPWWAWALIAIGAGLTIVFGLAALSSAQDRAASQEILRSLPASEYRLEGPSSRRAALQNQGPPGIVDRYLTAERRLERARREAGFGLAVLLLGISLRARQSARFATTGRGDAPSRSKSAASLDPFRCALLDGWALAEIVALSAFRLIAVTFLYLLIARTASGTPPTWDVVQETLDRVIAIIAGLTEMVR